MSNIQQMMARLTRAAIDIERSHSGGLGPTHAELAELRAAWCALTQLGGSYYKMSELDEFEVDVFGIRFGASGARL
tara:strand:+ start:6056 stop:6283 length:228 start_codon:yes stop_codon:yes gene_type:complete